MREGGGGICGAVGERRSMSRVHSVSGKGCDVLCVQESIPYEGALIYLRWTIQYIVGVVYIAD